MLHDSDLPSSIIRFYMLHGTRDSTTCPPRFRARGSSPMIDFVPEECVFRVGLTVETDSFFQWRRPRILHGLDCAIAVERGQSRDTLAVFGGRNHDLRTPLSS